MHDARLRRLLVGSWKDTSGSVYLTVDPEGACQIQFPDETGSALTGESKMIMKDATGYINLADLNLIIFLNLDVDRTDVLHLFIPSETGRGSYLNETLHRVPPP